MPDVKGSMPAPVDTHSSRPTETPKDLKKRVRGLDKSLTNVHERLVQTEKQIFDLERSYLEETRLYGNVLQGWDAYLDIKGKEKGGEIVAGAKRGIKRAAAVKNEDGEDEIGEMRWSTSTPCGAMGEAHHVIAAVSKHSSSSSLQSVPSDEWKPQHDDTTTTSTILHSA